MDIRKFFAKIVLLGGLLHAILGCYWGVSPGVFSAIAAIHQALQHLDCSTLECQLTLHTSFHSELRLVECNLNPQSKMAWSFGVAQSVE